MNRRGFLANLAKGVVAVAAAIHLPKPVVQKLTTKLEPFYIQPTRISYCYDEEYTAFLNQLIKEYNDRKELNHDQPRT